MKHPSKWSKGEAGMVFISLPLLWGLVSTLTYLVAAYGLVVMDVFAAVLSLTGGAILLHQHREAEHRRDIQIIGEENKRKYNAARVARASYYSLQPGEAVLPLRPKVDPPQIPHEHHNPFTLEPEECTCQDFTPDDPPHVPRMSLFTRLS